MPTKRTLDRRAIVHARVIDVAWRLAHEHGITGVSLREVAREMGMQAPSLYSYFDSKNAIFESMFEASAREYLAREVRLVLTGDRVADLTAGILLVGEFAMEDPERYRLLFQRRIPGFEPSAGALAIVAEAQDVRRRRLAILGLVDRRSVDLLVAVALGIIDQQLLAEPSGGRWRKLAAEAAQLVASRIPPETKAGKKRRKGKA